MGYHRAGFEVVGVDIKPQKNYPFEFHQADAMTYPLEGFDVIHASPPCQAYSNATRHLATGDFPKLIPEVRRRIAHKIYIIENVPGAPLINPITLCGALFGLDTYRHRLFESNIVKMPFIFHRQHGLKSSRAGHWKPGTLISVAGNVAPFKYAKIAMGIDWMSREELAESIPPAYTEFIGKQLMEHLIAACVNRGKPWHTQQRGE